MDRHEDPGPYARFPTTSLSAVAGMASDDAAVRQRSLAALRVAAYWKPVYKHARTRWRRSSEDAQDIAQGFFARAMEAGFFEAYDPAKARFRTFLRLCLDRFIGGFDRAARAQKRGGAATFLSLDFALAEGELAGAEPAVDTVFDREWVRSIFEIGVDSLRAECQASGKAVHFRLFEALDLAATDDQPRPSYEALARALDLSVTSVTNHLAWARRRLRHHVLARLRRAGRARPRAGAQLPGGAGPER